MAFLGSDSEQGSETSQIGVNFRNFLKILGVFLGPHPRHMEVPRLGVKSELHLLAYTTATAILDSEPHLQPTPQLTGNAGSLTH